jgi:hypothetical protein
VFDSLTRPRANYKPRILINDGFETHKLLEVIRFYYELVISYINYYSILYRSSSFIILIFLDY